MFVRCQYHKDCTNKHCYHYWKHEKKWDCESGFCNNMNVEVSCVVIKGYVDSIFDDLIKEIENVGR